MSRKTKHETRKTERKNRGYTGAACCAPTTLNKSKTRNTKYETANEGMVSGIGEVTRGSMLRPYGSRSSKY